MTEEYLGYNHEDSNRDGYPQFEANLQSFFDNAISNGKQLFHTNVENLHDTYLSNLPEEARQHFTCNACRNFVNRFGGLVIINEDGTMESAMWNEDVTPKFFVPSVIAMKKAVLEAKVVSVFIPEEKVLGTPRTGEWTHLALRLPSSMVNRSVLKNAFQLMAAKRENFGVLARSVQDFSLDTVNQAMTLLQSETMYRADRVIAPARWFKGFLESLENVSGERKRNLMWLAVATQPEGFVKIRSGMIGTLFEDIAAGLTTRVVAARFAEKMDPSRFQRSQSAPSVNAIREHEAIFQRFVNAGIVTEESLQRKYVTNEPIPLLWSNEYKEKAAKSNGGGVFGHLTPKAKPSVLEVPTSTMTWEKFKRTILPSADNIEALTDNANRFMALVTAADDTAPNILQWDNSFSWYYHGGIDGEIKRRVEEAGGRYENNEIRVSLIWEGLTDLDLHCITPRREQIYYGDKKAQCGGYLDLDMNGLDQHSRTPVENMRWANNAPEGKYHFFVNNFSERVNGYKGTPFKVELEINGKIYHYEGQALRNKEKVIVFEFDYIKGQQPFIGISSSNSSSNDAWGVPANSFVKVTGITTSPNMWGETPMPQSGNHTFFLLDGVKDDSEGKGRGFFNETLKSELREIRKTLEAFTASAPIEGADDATACGLGFSTDSEWNLTLKVTLNNSTRIIKIDRFD